MIVNINDPALVPMLFCPCLILVLINVSSHDRFVTDAIAFGRVLVLVATILVGAYPLSQSLIPRVFIRIHGRLLQKFFGHLGPGRDKAT